MKKKKIFFSICHMFIAPVITRGQVYYICITVNYSGYYSMCGYYVATRGVCIYVCMYLYLCHKLACTCPTMLCIAHTYMRTCSYMFLRTSHTCSVRHLVVTSRKHKCVSHNNCLMCVNLAQTNVQHLCLLVYLQLTNLLFLLTCSLASQLHGTNFLKATRILVCICRGSSVSPRGNGPTTNSMCRHYGQAT